MTSPESTAYKQLVKAQRRIEILEHNLAQQREGLARYRAMRTDTLIPELRKENEMLWEENRRLIATINETKLTRAINKARLAACENESSPSPPPTAPGSISLRARTAGRTATRTPPPAE